MKLTLFHFFHAGWSFGRQRLFIVADQNVEAARGRLWIDDPVWREPGVFYFPELDKPISRKSRWGFDCEVMGSHLWKKTSSNRMGWRLMDLPT